jgi:hypothetical protein
LLVKTFPYSLFWSMYQVDLSHLQMVIAGCIYNYEHVISQRLIIGMENLIWSQLISTNYSSPACVQVMKLLSSEEWHVAVSSFWFIWDACCESICLRVFIAMPLRLTNWSSLETCLWSVRWFKLRADLNKLNHLKVILRSNSIWNICVIWYFSPAIN